MIVHTIMIMALLMCLNAAFGIYIYVRFGPRSLIMKSMTEEKLKQYRESFPPLSTLNPHGRRLVLYMCMAAALSLLLLSELLHSI